MCLLSRPRPLFFFFFCSFFSFLLTNLQHFRLNQFVRDLDRQLNTFGSVHERANFLQHLLAETESSISTMKSSEGSTKSPSTNNSTNDSSNARGKNSSNSNGDDEEDDETVEVGKQLAEIYAMLSGGRPKNVAQKQVCIHPSHLYFFLFLFSFLFLPSLLLLCSWLTLNIDCGEEDIPTWLSLTHTQARILSLPIIRAPPKQYLLHQ